MNFRSKNSILVVFFCIYMLDRHLLRSIILQTLFEWDVQEEERKGNIDINGILLENLKEFGQVNEIPDFAGKMLSCILEKQEDLDNIIQQAAPQWPINKIPVVDRNILRIGISELLFSDRDEVPPKVAINEAIELAKAFGGENSSKFISGVMGTIYKELGEPQKHETSDSRKKEIDSKNLPTHDLSGVMIYSKEDNLYKVAMVHNIFGYWTLLKGKEKNEKTSKENIIDKAKQKIGLEIKLEEKIGGNEYVAFHTEEGHVKRKTEYFLAKSESVDFVLKHDEGKEGPTVLDDVKWFKLSELGKLEIYEDLRPIVEKGIKILLEKQKELK